MVRLKMMVHIFGALKSPIDGIFFVNTPEKGTEPNAVQKAKGLALFLFKPHAGLRLHTYV
jgi:hypothetical protein